MVSKLHAVSSPSNENINSSYILPSLNIESLDRAQN